MILAEMGRTLFLKIYLKAYILYFFITPILHSLKLIRYGAEYGAYSFYFFSSLFFVLILLHSIINLRKLINGRIFFMDIVLALIFIVSVSSTVVFGGDIIDITGNFMRLLSTMLLFINCRQFLNKEYAGNYIKRLAIAGLIGETIALIVCYYIVIRGGSVYLGLGTENLLPFIGNNIQTSALKMFVGIFMVIMGGKRGMILSAVLGVIVVLWGIGQSEKLKKMVAPIILISTIISLLYIAIQNESVYNSLPVAMRNRIKPFVEKSSNNDLDYTRATAGRDLEVYAVLKSWEEYPISIITGQGLGAAFQLYGSNTTDSTVHISPLAISFICGVPLGILLYLNFFFILFKFKRSRKKDTVWYYIFVVNVMNSFTVFTIFQSPIIWISLAYLYNSHYESFNFFKKKTLSI